MKKFAVTLLILVLLAAAVLAGATIVYAGTDEYKKPSPRETPMSLSYGRNNKYEMTCYES